MAQIKLLKINSSGVPQEFDSTADEITLLSFSIDGGGPVLSGTGLDLNNQDVVDVKDIAMSNPATGTINQSAGNLIIDDIVAKDRDNDFTASGSILMSNISDTAGEVDALRLPELAGSPTATPTASGEGFVVWDSVNKKMFIWDGAAWDDQSTVQSAQHLDYDYIAGEIVTAAKAVYISAANEVSLAVASSPTTASAIGFTMGSAAALSPVTVRKAGVVPGLTGLTAGSRYFLDGTTPGAITSTAPTGTGNTLTQVGFALSTTELDLQFQNLGRRA